MPSIIPISSNLPLERGGKSGIFESDIFQIFGEMQGDAMNNSYVCIPSLKSVVCGDIVYNGVYPWTLETTPAEREEWIKKRWIRSYCSNLLL